MLRIERDKVEGTEHGEATLALTQPCFEVLQRRHRNRPTDKFESEYVFQSERVRNKPVTTLHSIQLAIDKVGLNANERLVKKKGKFTPHSLRNSYASLLAQSGKVSLYDLQQVLGHTTPQMTQKYANLIPDEVSTKIKRVLEDGLMSRAS